MGDLIGLGSCNDGPKRESRQMWSDSTVGTESSKRTKSGIPERRNLSRRSSQRGRRVSRISLGVHPLRDRRRDPFALARALRLELVARAQVKSARKRAPVCGWKHQARHRGGRRTEPITTECKITTFHVTRLGGPLWVVSGQRRPLAAVTAFTT